MKFLSRLFVVVLALMGLGLVFGGGWLIGLGGSWYYFLLGAAWLYGAWMMWRGRSRGAWAVVAAAALTLPWAIWEAGFAFWPLFARLMAPIAVAGFATLFMPALSKEPVKQPFRVTALAALILFIVGFAGTFREHGVIRPSADIPNYTLAKGDNTPMTYVSPKTGKQYVLVSVGGAPYSAETGDYVMAFALKD